MRTMRAVVIGAVIVIVAACSRESDEVRVPPSAIKNGRQADPSRLETVEYRWESLGVRVSFSQGKRDDSWTMMVRDTRDIFEVAEETAVKWGPESSRCSTEECLRIIDLSLTEFHTDRPDANLESFFIEMHVDRELWAEVIAVSRRGLLAMGDEVFLDGTDSPQRVDEEIAGVLGRSTTIQAVAATLLRRGVTPGDVSVGVQPVYRFALIGRKWSDLASLSDVGLQYPGYIEIDLRGSKITAR